MAQLLRPQESWHLYVALQRCQRPCLCQASQHMMSHFEPRSAAQHASFLSARRHTTSQTLTANHGRKSMLTLAGRYAAPGREAPCHHCLPTCCCNFLLNAAGLSVKRQQGGARRYPGKHGRPESSCAALEGHWYLAVFAQDGRLRQVVLLNGSWLPGLRRSACLAARLCLVMHLPFCRSGTERRTQDMAMFHYQVWRVKFGASS